MRRIGFSRVCSSMTCATSRGARAIMKMPLNAAGFTPRSAKIAPMATSTLIGSDFFRGGEGFLNCARRLHMNATHAGFTREFEQGAVRGSLVCNR